MSLIHQAQLAAVLFKKALTQQERVSTELEHTSGQVRDSDLIPTQSLTCSDYQLAQ